MGGHNIFHGGPLFFHLQGDILVALLNVFLCLHNHLRPKEMGMHQVMHSFEGSVANLIMSPSQSGLPMCGQQDQLKLGLLGFFGQNLSIQDTPLQLEVVVFLTEQPDLRWVGQFQWALAQVHILHPHNHRDQDRICLPGLMPIVHGHAGFLQTIPY